MDLGSNQLEIVEFCVSDEYYGINISKIREIIRCSEEIVPIPKSHPSVSGIINLREYIIPVIHLAKHLSIPTEYDMEKSRIIVSEFNKVRVGFWVSFVTRIQRLSWKDVEAPSGIVQSKAGYASGIVKFENRIIVLLDLEKITGEINPELDLEKVANISVVKRGVDFDRSTKTILIVEDSPFMRDLLIKFTKEAGYQNKAVCNGQEALDYLEKLSRSSDDFKIEDHIQLVITDLEMPQLDGLSLVKNIKDTDLYRKLPCMVFSSVISEEMSYKCQSVGSVAQITKPEIESLVNLVDDYIL